MQQERKGWGEVRTDSAVSQIAGGGPLETRAHRLLSGALGPKDCTKSGQLGGLRWAVGSQELSAGHEERGGWAFPQVLTWKAHLGV